MMLALVATVPSNAQPLDANSQLGNLIQVSGCDDTQSQPPSNGTASRHVRRNSDCFRKKSVRRVEQTRQFYDCHRDVRTHRIGGVRVRHRHVGDNCAIREVRTSTTD